MNKNIITVFVSFILLILAGCGGGGGSGGTTQTPGGTNPTGAAMITIAGSLSSVVPAANLPVAVQDATGITDWSGATLTITNSKGELVAEPPVDSKGNFKAFVFTNEQYFFRVTIGNLVLLYYLPPSTTGQVVEIGPESTSTFMVLIQITGLELGIPGVVVPDTPAELDAAIGAIDETTLAEATNTMAQGIKNGYSPQGPAPSVGAAFPLSIEDSMLIADVQTGTIHTHDITITASSGGSVSPSGTVAIAHGTDLIVTLTPDACFIPSTIKLRELFGMISFTVFLSETSKSYTYKKVDIDNSLDFKFEEDKYTILKTFNKNEGTITGANFAICDSPETMTITANSGYVIADVKIDRLSIGAADSYTFLDSASPIEIHQIEAIFALQVGTAWTGSDTTDRFPSGTQGNGDSGEVSLNEAGNLVSVTSTADNVVTPDTNGQRDIFIFDSLTSTTTKVSVAAGSSSDPFSGVSGSQSSLVSSDGRYTVFSSTDAAPAPIQTQTFATGIAVSNPTADTNNVSDIFIYDAQNDLTKRVSVPNHADQGMLGTEANKASNETAISGDARYVAFNSLANNLVLGDTNNTVDVFLHDTQTGETKRVSIPNLSDQGSLGSEGSGNSMWGVSLNGDGSKVVFHAFTTNLVVGDTNGEGDLFIHDTLTGETKRISVPNLADQGALGTEADGDSSKAMISADGKFVVFESNASNLVVGDTNVFCDLFQNGVLKNCPDIFSYEIATGIVKRLSVDSNGAESNGACRDPSISNDGLYVAFECGATNLVPGDTNNTCDNNFDGVLAENCFDIFVHNTQTGATARVSVADDGSQGDGRSSGAAISGNGQYVGYESDATNLVPGDTNGFRDAFRTPNPLYVAPSP